MPLIHHVNRVSNALACLADLRAKRGRLLGSLLACVLWPIAVSAAETLRFATGPFRPSIEATKAEFEPLFRTVAETAGIVPEIVIAKDWPSLGQAIERGEVDVAWMGGAMRYLYAAAKGGGPAIATVAYDGAPTIRSIIVARPGLEVADFPRGGANLSISFTHNLSTTGWLMPYMWLKSQGIDPKTQFRFQEGASHVDNMLIVASGKVDLATDNANNRLAMIADGRLKAEAARILWTSEPMPLDPIQVRKGLDPELTKRLQAAFVAIKPEVMPMKPHYTGFFAAGPETYADFERAMRELGLLK